MIMTTSLLIGFDKADNGDIPVLIVGRKQPGDVVEIINAFQGEEAEALYNKLVTKREKTEGE
jgi:hypothetical protein